jgi:hypothetical protein
VNVDGGKNEMRDIMVYDSTRDTINMATISLIRLD